MSPPLQSAFCRLGRVLTFRFQADDVEHFGWTDLAVGLAFTWVAGMGRYWDDPRGEVLQRLGIGSLIYVFVLSAGLWILARPFTHPAFTYRRLLTFVTFTSPPALLYAIPIEHFTDLKTGNVINLTFLLVVSVWRLSLYGTYLIRFGRCGLLTMVGLVLLPVCLIVSSLAALNLHHVVFNIMGGIRDADKSVHDASYEILWVLTFFSFPVTVVAGVWWLFATIFKGLSRNPPRT